MVVCLTDIERAVFVFVVVCLTDIERAAFAFGVVCLTDIERVDFAFVMVCLNCYKWYISQIWKELPLLLGWCV